ncbi:translation initiation factor IF-2-like [Sphaerodactylus townsendi]|uniref:translation initiation factor IF-2-like n=1 Tax=Sphaerodactylus townsendi TaxID=933632 RepID=UPI0020275BD1|nr:translation initiation factor IF-2-like [Sphaerodactylus townsendi]
MAESLKRPPPRPAAAAAAAFLRRGLARRWPLRRCWECSGAAGSGVLRSPPPPPDAARAAAAPLSTRLPRRSESPPEGRGRQSGRARGGGGRPSGPSLPSRRSSPAEPEGDTPPRQGSVGRATPWGVSLGPEGAAAAAGRAEGAVRSASPHPRTPPPRGQAEAGGPAPYLPERRAGHSLRLGRRAGGRAVTPGNDAAPRNGRSRRRRRVTRGQRERERERQRHETRMRPRARGPASRLRAAPRRAKAQWPAGPASPRGEGAASTSAARTAGGEGGRGAEAASAFAGRAVRKPPPLPPLAPREGGAVPRVGGGVEDCQREPPTPTPRGSAEERAGDATGWQVGQSAAQEARPSLLTGDRFCNPHQNKPKRTPGLRCTEA